MTLLLFITGMVEYALAAAWTRSVAKKQPAVCAALSFVNVMIWGMVVSTVASGSWPLLVAHAAGCAVGAALTVRYLE